ncbi:glucan endo-1,3-beta-glucosidase 3-like [Olea europaea var. sylvestris]|uniref:glucan endo-1,3-beta-glucosidase 3-like n=1 Tax=Olea europaea var. sylvestris TaxID=158386 RepID=UPI000C1D28B3|nr:glucan endo-1,3-beta-glucosidase 3-like [Olea europaea var. sylvestris]
MKGGMHTRSMFFLFYFLCISDTIIAVELPSEAIRKGKKITYQENQMIFSSSASTTLRDTTTGNVPIVNPTPGTTPSLNPNTPPAPTNTGPTITPPTPTGPTITPTTPTGPTITPPTPTGPTITPPTTTGPTITPPTTNGPPTTPTSSGGAWCIASPSASETALQVALDYACGYGGTDCSAIQQGASCYDPNTVRDHASYAFNSYYQKNPSPTSCDFGGVAQLTNTDPSHGNCHFASSTTSGTPPATPTMPTTPMTPPSTTSPSMPGGGIGSGIPSGYDNGSAPIGTPSSAKTSSYSLLLLITMNCVLLSIATEIYS